MWQARNHLKSKLVLTAQHKPSCHPACSFSDAREQQGPAGEGALLLPYMVFRESTGLWTLECRNRTWSKCKMHLVLGTHPRNLRLNKWNLHLNHSSDDETQIRNVDVRGCLFQNLIRWQIKAPFSWMKEKSCSPCSKQLVSCVMYSFFRLSVFLLHLDISAGSSITLQSSQPLV